MALEQVNQLVELAEKEIQELKAKYGQIYLIEFEDGKKAYLKKPDRKILSLAMTKMQTNPLGFAETILNQCFVVGNEDVKTNDDYFLGAAAQLEALMEVKNAELKKL